jgi:hypothetical protein
MKPIIPTLTLNSAKLRPNMSFLSPGFIIIKR